MDHGVEVGPAITLVPLPWLAYPEMLVEIEAVAMLGEDGARLTRSTVNPRPALGDRILRQAR